MSVSARPTVVPALCYRDPRAAFEWLQSAFGFEVEMLIEDEAGVLLHSELRFGDGIVMVGSEWAANTRSPTSVGAQSNLGLVCTQTVHVRVGHDIDGHCERARSADAQIVMEPETQFYGDRTYRAIDPEGHLWTFVQTVTPMSPAEWDRVIGSRTTVGRNFSQPE